MRLSKNKIITITLFILCWFISTATAKNDNDIEIVLDTLISEKTFNAKPSEIIGIFNTMGSMTILSQDDTEMVLESNKINGQTVSKLSSRYQASYDNTGKSSWDLLSHTVYFQSHNNCFEKLNMALSKKLGNPSLSEKRRGQPYTEWLFMKNYGVILTIENKMCRLKCVVYQGEAN